MIDTRDQDVKLRSMVERAEMNAPVPARTSRGARRLIHRLGIALYHLKRIKRLKIGRLRRVAPRVFSKYLVLKVCGRGPWRHPVRAPGDISLVSHSALVMSAVQMTAHVADTKGVASVVLRNVGLEPLDVPVGTVWVMVFKFE